MMGGKLLSYLSYFFRNGNSIYGKIKKIQNGDNVLRETVIKEYIPFIKKNVSKAAGKYFDIESTEEFSIGLSAFNEALNSFDVKKGENFFNYCRTVIGCRILDYQRSNKKNRNVFPFTYFQDEHGNYLENKYMVDNCSQLNTIESMDEIQVFKSNLMRFGINFDDLVLYSPKHKDSVRQCVRIARLLAENECLFSMLLHKKSIPLKELMKLVDVHQRTVERNRKFIITISLMLRSDLDVLKGYIHNVEEGGASVE